MDSPIGIFKQHDKFQKSKSSSTKQLQLQIASVYTQISKMIKQHGDLQIEMPKQVITSVQRINLIKSVFAYILDLAIQNQQKQPISQSDRQFPCTQCSNYQKNLQKLQSEIRIHIKTYQQLKLFSDTLQETLQQQKKQKKQLQIKNHYLQKKYQNTFSHLIQYQNKIQSMQKDNQYLRQLLSQYQSNLQQQHHSFHHPDQKYQSNKQNLYQTKPHHFYNQNRFSIQKKPQSSQKLRISLHSRSTKAIPISSKIVQQKSKEQKAKILKYRLGF